MSVVSSDLRRAAVTGGRLLAAIWLALLFVLPASASAQTTTPAPFVYVLDYKGTINPAAAQYLERAISAAERDGANAVVIVLDTPGGLASSMGDITRRIINARVPVVVYVGPSGARAASAGLFITMAAHVAAMAPSTNIGSASVVSGGPSSGGDDMSDTMRRKVTNDAVANIRGMAELRGRNADWAEQAVRDAVNVSSREALELKVIDLLAEDVPALIRQIHGREVTLVTGPVRLDLANAQLRPLGMTAFESVLATVAEPTVAYILFIVGVNGLIYELASPGSILPGVVGVIALLLALYGLGTLSVNFAGIALIVFAFALLVAELKVQSSGILGVGGIVSLVLGSLLLFDPAEGLAVSPLAIATVAIFTAIFFAVVIRLGIRALRSPVDTGREGLFGAHGEARSDLRPRGQVFVHGERWLATTEDGEIFAGQPIRVVAVDGLHLRVRAAGPPPAVAAELPAAEPTSADEASDHPAPLEATRP
ncbi:MAG: nodulation protein NfeD [Chloroflexi bacterium]|nr:nodulation protein NfeD [Chloroflexota bacterium]